MVRQLVEHEPQWEVLVFSSVSQPSLANPLQSANPGWQVTTTHSPEEHLPPAVLGRAEQLVPQLPQSWVEDERSTSQPFEAWPSQLPVVPRQATTPQLRGEKES